MGRHVAGDAGVDIRAPDAADAVAALEDHDVVLALLLQLDRGGDAAEAGADDRDRDLPGHGCNATA